MKAHYSSNEL